MSAVIGVDPGVRGGLTLLDPQGAVINAEGFQPGMTHAALVNACRQFWSALWVLDSRCVFIEKVGYMPGDGGKGANTFGRVDGLLRGAFLALGATVYDAAPMIWQAAMSCLTGGDKSVTRRRAAELWPATKWTNATADSALIAEYGRRVLLRQAGQAPAPRSSGTR